MNEDALIRKENLRRALEARSMTVSDLAKLPGAKRVSYYSDLLNLNMEKAFGEKSARAIEDLLQLRRGELDEVATNDRARTHAGVDNVARVTSALVVPVVPWDKVALVVQGAGPADLADSFLRCPVPTSQRTFAVRVRGDSMTSPHGRSYPDGCAIFVDPERNDPPSGTRVLAMLATGETTFKVFRSEDGARWLQPLNPQYPAVREPFKIIGTVVGKWEDD